MYNWLVEIIRDESQRIKWGVIHRYPQRKVRKSRREGRRGIKKTKSLTRGRSQTNKKDPGTAPTTSAPAPGQKRYQRMSQSHQQKLGIMRHNGRRLRPSRSCHDPPASLRRQKRALLLRWEQSRPGSGLRNQAAYRGVRDYFQGRVAPAEPDFGAEGQVGAAADLTWSDSILIIAHNITHDTNKWH